MDCRFGANRMLALYVLEIKLEMLSHCCDINLTKQSIRETNEIDENVKIP